VGPSRPLGSPCGDGQLTGGPRARQPPPTPAFRERKYCVSVTCGYSLSVRQSVGRKPVAHILRLDDPYGSKGAETVRFDVDGQGCEVDLAEAGRQRFAGFSRSLFAAGRGPEPQPGGGGRRAECGASRQPDVIQVWKWEIGWSKSASRHGRGKRDHRRLRRGITDDELSVNAIIVGRGVVYPPPRTIRSP